MGLPSSGERNAFGTRDDALGISPTPGARLMAGEGPSQGMYVLKHDPEECWEWPASDSALLILSGFPARNLREARKGFQLWDSSCGLGVVVNPKSSDPAERSSSVLLPSRPQEGITDLRGEDTSRDAGERDCPGPWEWVSTAPLQ